MEQEGCAIVEKENATYVSDAFYRVVTARPDWGEIEKRIKSVLGHDWKLKSIGDTSIEALRISASLKDCLARMEKENKAGGTR